MGTKLKMAVLAAAAITLGALPGWTQTTPTPKPGVQAATPATGGEAGTSEAQNAASAEATDDSAGYAPQKVVYHINTPGGDAGEAYRGAINNLGNHLDALGDENAEIKVVLHGDGVEMLQDAVTNQQLAGRIADLRNRGVQFVVCRNTLEGRNIDPASLYEVWDEDIVPSGVAEVARLQQDGYVYVKP